jgi:23S rRNA (pseudouridine1915-N3)-methyltransferase
LRLTVVAVGRMKAGPERELLERYVKRLAGLGASLGISGVEWREVWEGRARRDDDRRAEEARAILGDIS